MDLGHLLDAGRHARARLLLLLRRAARHAHGPRRRTLDARTVVNEWPERAARAVFREYGEERYARAIAREIVRRRERAPIETTTELVDAIKRAVPDARAVRAAGTRPSAPSRRSGSPSTTSSARSTGRCPRPGTLLRPGGRIAAISFHSLEDRRVKRFFADRARGCICPPELPVCVCGHEPEAELLTRRAISPSAGEVAGNPRARSGTLRAALQARDEEEPVTLGQAAGAGPGCLPQTAAAACRHSGHAPHRARRQTRVHRRVLGRRVSGPARGRGGSARRSPLRAPLPQPVRARLGPARARAGARRLRDSPVVDRLVRGRMLDRRARRRC